MSRSADAASARTPHPAGTSPHRSITRFLRAHGSREPKASPASFKAPA
ncbi:MAG: hypothetical protein Q8L55_12430 [Phycisphaerales bacterium]|nr:hypothetical protein [Phycisphaerales bacterium]